MPGPQPGPAIRTMGPRLPPSDTHTTLTPARWLGLHRQPAPATPTTRRRARSGKPDTVAVLMARSLPAPRKPYNPGKPRGPHDEPRRRHAQRVIPALRFAGTGRILHYDHRGYGGVQHHRRCGRGPQSSGMWRLDAVTGRLSHAHPGLRPDGTGNRVPAGSLASQAAIFAAAPRASSPPVAV